MKPQKIINWILVGLSSVILILTRFGSIALGNSPLDDLAIKGYDTVAYFTAGKALKGDDSFTYQWHDKTWHFLTKENRDLFATKPEQYAPQYDGYCAWAMTQARKARTDPEVWEIVDGKLYLNCSRSAYEKWRKDIPGNIKKADANWLKFNSRN
jgi:hypothetical protein